MLRLTLKSLLQHKIRFALTTFAVVIGVAFVVGALVLTDSVRAQFNGLFNEINQGIDLQVRAKSEFDQGAFGANAPISESLVGTVAGVQGVAAAEGGVGGLPALLIGSDGQPVKPLGGPPLGTSWGTEPRLSQLTLVDGKQPDGPGQVAYDIDTAKKGKVAVGDKVTVSTPQGSEQFLLVGTFEFGKGNALSGATLAAFTLPEAQRVFNLPGQVQQIAIAVAAGQDPAQVQARIQTLLPDGVEVVTTDTVVKESQNAVGQIVDIFGTVLLVFAGITLFVSAFLISNTFSIVVSQRIRELALLRAIGASTRQVGVAVVGEALVIGLLSSVVGFVLGILFALGLEAILNAGGLGTSGTSLVIAPRSFIAAFIIGVGVTVLSSILPARRATTVPPVAAMREDAGFAETSGRVRTGFALAMAVVGIALFMWAVFAKPAGMLIGIGMGLGAALAFLGVALLSSVIAGPLARLIGAPFKRLYKEPGLLAEQNASRSPRRTASTAAALMIGLALVTGALVIGQSFKDSFKSAIGSSIKADWYISTGSFYGFSPTVVEQLKNTPEVTAVSGGRQGQIQVNGSTKQVTSTDLGVVDQLFDLKVQSGSLSESSRGLLIYKDPAADLGVKAGDVVTVVFNDTGAKQIPVVAVYDDNRVLGSWILDEQTFNENFASVTTDGYAAARTAPGVSAADARAAIEKVIAPFPELKAQDRAEFTKSTEDRLNTLLLVVNVFLFFAVVIAFIGIMNTLALSVFERTRELGLLRAVGMSRRQVRKMVRLEAVIIAVFGALLGVLLGLVFGLGAASALPKTVVTSISVPVVSLVLLVVLAGVIGVVAALWPAWRAGRLNVLDAIASE